MKPSFRVICIGLSIAFYGGSLLATPAGMNPEVKPAATHEELSKRLRILQQNDPLKTLKSSQESKEVGDPTSKNPPSDIFSTSDIICFGGRAALVPKRAIIHNPANLVDRLSFKEGSKLVTWSEFYQFNIGWISVIEVSRSQAEGKTPFSPDVQKQVEKSTNLVVATYKGGPISVLPLQTPQVSMEKEKTQ